MTVRQLYASATGTTGIESATISTNHSSSCATAIINSVDTDLEIGDEITVDLGYYDDHGTVFTGYVKTKDKQAPNNTYSVTAMDKLIRAIDYFIVSTSPDQPYNYGKNISCEDLISNVLSLCGLSLTYITPTSFVFGINNDVEVNLVSCYDYSRMLSDIVTWSLWADQNGELHFKNRKPFYMGSETFGQGGWVDDGTPTLSIDSNNIISFSYKRSEKDTRNKIAVFGGQGVSYIASNSQTWDPFDGAYKTIFPADYYKTIVASYSFIDDSSLAENIGNYNLGLYNRIKDSISTTVEGNYRYLARNVISVNETITGVSGNFYILTSDLSFTQEGFTASMELTR